MPLGILLPSLRLVKRRSKGSKETESTTQLILRVRYSCTFSENLTLPLGLVTAHPVRRDEWGEVSTGEVSGVLESNEQLEHSIPTEFHRAFKQLRCTLCFLAAL